MNRGDVDSFLAHGCGRCEFYRTPQCKVHPWAGPLRALRALLLAAGLDEGLKWGSPCYTLEGKNVVMLVALRGWCGLSFFQGTLLPDEAGLLEAPGPNTQVARVLRFTAAEQVAERRDPIRRYVEAAIALARSGARVERVTTPGPVPAELQARLDDDPALQAAFEALTPGRRRSHVLHVEGAKQSATRATRAAKCVARILAGKGFNER